MNSLRLRLLFGAIIGIGLALAVAGIVLVAIFDAHVRSRFVKELDDHLLQLIAMIEAGPSGNLQLKQDLSEPEFRRPLSGHYWQVARNDRIELRSRSLWDETLPRPAPELPPGAMRSSAIRGPAHAKLVLVERTIEVPSVSAAPLNLSVAGDSAVIDAARREFSGDVALSLAVLGLLLSAAAWLQVGAGLAPLQTLKTSLDAIDQGRSASLDGNFPIEVQSLAAALNRLIETQTKEVERARSNAAKLGHGLKTPLAVVAAQARELRDAGSVPAADALELEINAMDSQIVRAIAAARAVGKRAAIGTRNPVTPVLERLVNIMKKLPGGAQCAWRIQSTGEPAVVAIDVRDLEDLFGNLLDNARKWALNKVDITVTSNAGTITIAIADDGPGIPPAHISSAIKRGVRLDRTVPGTGVGLSIVDDLVELHAGELLLGQTAGGGLTITVKLAAASDG